MLIWDGDTERPRTVRAWNSSISNANTSICGEHRRALAAVLAHGRYILGPVEELEQAPAAFVGVEHCTVSRAKKTPCHALMALGIGRDDEVITTPFTFIATAESIALLGAKPVFVDIDARTYNIDPALIERAITPRTRAIMPVSLYGQCADMDAINAIAARHGLPVIEDAAQSFGATYKGRRSCALSTIGCTSFFPSKPLGCYGDGGACFTDEPTLAKAMREIRVHGQDRRYHHPVLGLNGRLDTLQAAVLLAKLPNYEEELAARQRVAAGYAERIAAARPEVALPYVEPGNQSAYAQYTIALDNRDAVCAVLGEADPDRHSLSRATPSAAGIRLSRIPSRQPPDERTGGGPGDESADASVSRRPRAGRRRCRAGVLTDRRRSRPPATWRPKIGFAIIRLRQSSGAASSLANAAKPSSLKWVSSRRSAEPSVSVSGRQHIPRSRFECASAPVGRLRCERPCGETRYRR